MPRVRSGGRQLSDFALRLALLVCLGIVIYAAAHLKYTV